MTIEALLPEHAAQIHGLARDYYQADLCPPVSELEQSLWLAEEEGRHWSLGAWEGEHLRGYLLAWLDETRAEGSQEQVVLIEDLLAGSGCHPASLLERLVLELEQAGLGHLALESTLIPNQPRLLEICRQCLEGLGYESVAEDSLETRVDSPEMTWQRYRRPD